MITREFWTGRRVFITGHTGFKGGWLALWLQTLGAEVHGYALDPPTVPSFFSAAGVQSGLASHTVADIRDFATLSNTMAKARPEIVFHLAAQPLVRESYRQPIDTYATNVMGVVHLLEAVRVAPAVRAVVNVTTDKCYENDNRAHGYREDDPMGGHDPYSSSKACAELVSAAYRRSFLAEAGVAIATARAGNVIGGGDWGTDRLLPDVLRAFDAGDRVVIRSPEATRPWQHVLEPLSGYMQLAQRLVVEGPAVAEAWNFGPSADDARPVRWIVDRACARHPPLSWEHDRSPQAHEANQLVLDSSKARTRLGWHPRWNLEAALDRTFEWHDAWRRGDNMRETSLAQIREYMAARALEVRVTV